MISIVIPAYNEHRSIEKTIYACVDVLKANSIAYQIIVVDDGSSDGTSEIAKKCGVDVISHPHNLGYGRSLKDGILAAKFDTVVITDADMTYPIDQIPLLYNTYREGFDMVVGARTGRYYDESIRKKILRIILKELVEYTAGRKIADINSGFRIFSRKSILPYNSYLCDTFSFTTSLTLAYMMNGKFVQYIPITYQDRVGNSKVRLFRDSLRTLQFIIEAMVFYNPMKVFLAIFLILFVHALIFFILGVLLNIISFIITSLLIVTGGMIVFSIGLVSVQLKQLLSNSHRK